MLIRESLPDPFNSTMDDFQKMIVLKSLRPDKVTNAMQDYLSQKLGQQFIEPQSSDLSAMFKESGPAVPLIFVLSTGTDPAADLYKFADRMKMGKRMFSISLGQGQGPRAERLIKDAVEAGSWVFFQVGFAAEIQWRRIGKDFLFRTAIWLPVGCPVWSGSLKQYHRMWFIGTSGYGSPPLHRLIFRFPFCRTAAK